MTLPFFFFFLFLIPVKCLCTMWRSSLCVLFHAQYIHFVFWLIHQFHTKFFHAECGFIVPENRHKELNTSCPGCAVNWNKTTFSHFLRMISHAELESHLVPICVKYGCLCGAQFLVKVFYLFNFFVFGIPDSCRYSSFFISETLYTAFCMFN